MLEQTTTIVDEVDGATDLKAAELNKSAKSTPFVSIVIPCFNEERFIGKVLENLAAQYDTGRYEIVVVDGMSVDRTRELIAQFAAAHTDVPVRLVDNPARNIPTALNTGIKHARGDVIVRMDAHSVPSTNYVRRCVEVLNDSNVAVVGMPWRIQPGADTLAARAIALAVSHPFGIGDAKYRLPVSSGAQIVDTVPFGAFRKSLWQEMNGFNEGLLTNEDYDFNYRIRNRGGRILLDGSGYCNYFARATFKEIAAQYSRYGGWKARMVKLHPRSIKLRHIVAPSFVLSIIVLSALGLLSKFALWLLLGIMTAYAGLAFVCAVQLALKARDLRLIPFIAAVFVVLHVAWGGSFLLGLISAPRK